MLNALDSILDLKFDADVPPDLKESLKLMDRNKNRLFIYRVGFNDSPFSDISISDLTEKMSKVIGSETNLSLYALYLFWGSKLFVFNLIKEKGILKLSSASHIYLEPLARPFLLQEFYKLPFKELVSLPKQFRDDFSLAHAIEAQHYNEAIKKLINKLLSIENYLVQKYDFEPYFNRHRIEDFLYSLPVNLPALGSPKKTARAPSPFMDVLAPSPRSNEFKIHPYLQEMHQLAKNSHFQLVTPVSPHILFEHFWQINHEAMKMYTFIQRNQIYADLLEKFSKESRKFFIYQEETPLPSETCSLTEVSLDLSAQAPEDEFDRVISHSSLRREGSVDSELQNLPLSVLRYVDSELSFGMSRQSPIETEVGPFPEIASLFQDEHETGHFGFSLNMSLVNESIEPSTPRLDISSISESEENKDLVFKIMNKFSLEDMLKIIQTYDKTECDELIKLHENFSEDALRLFQGLVFQHQLDLLLKEFGVDNRFQPDTNRLILTTIEVPHGLRLIQKICEGEGEADAGVEKNKIDYSNLENLRAVDIRTLRIPKDVSLAKVEIAWGTLDVLIRKSPRPYISCSRELIQFYISKLGKNSTLILDGHGGTSDIRIGASSYSVTRLTLLVRELLNTDVNDHIKHLILQSCVSGKLKKTLEAPYYLKNKEKESGKQKIMIRDTPIEKVVKGKTTIECRDFFIQERPTDPICLAQAIINAIFLERKYVHIAFTFSPFLINPSYILGLGNVGVKPENRGEVSSFTEWGAEITPERFTQKTVTLFWGEHSKCNKLDEKYTFSGGPLSLTS